MKKNLYINGNVNTNIKILPSGTVLCSAESSSAGLAALSSVLAHLETYNASQSTNPDSVFLSCSWIFNIEILLRKNGGKY